MFSPRLIPVGDFMALGMVIEMFVLIWLLLSSTSSSFVSSLLRQNKLQFETGKIVLKDADIIPSRSHSHRQTDQPNL